MDHFIITAYILSSVQDKKTRHVPIYLDRNSIIDYSITPNLMVPKSLLEDFAKYKVIDEKYWYTTSHGAESYMMLNFSEGRYKIFNESMMVVGKYASNIAEKIFELFDESSEKYGEKNYKIDFISLGTGTARKEMKILEEFMIMYKDKRFGSEIDPVMFMPVDLSYALLMDTVDEVYKRFKIAISHDELKIKPQMMDFQNTEFDDFGSNKYRLITAFGIVPSMAMPDIFKTLENLMKKETLLLLDVGMVEDDKDMIKSYMDNAAKRFVSSPMELILKTAKYSKEIRKFDENIYQSVKAYEDVEMNLDDVHVKITTEEGLDQFIKEHNLPSDSKQKILVNSSAGSKTIIMIYEPPGQRTPCILGYSTRFTPEGFNEILSKTNLESVTNGPWIYHGKKIMYYLLRLKRSDTTKNKTNDKPTRKQNVSI